LTVFTVGTLKLNFSELSVLKNFNPFNASRDSLILGSGNAYLTVFRFNLHIERLDKVFTRLKEHGLKLKGKKCHFFKPQVKYLGHIISPKGIATDPEKINVVKGWPRPQNLEYSVIKNVLH
jgi:hypothetical protein